MSTPEPKPNLLHSILAERPDLMGQAVETPAEGKNGQTFLFPNEVFKASADPAKIPYIWQESKILHHVENAKLPVPRVTHVGQNAAVFGMTRLPGVTLTREIFDKLSQEELGALARDIAAFAAGFANCFVDKDDRSMVQIKGPYSVTAAAVMKALKHPPLRAKLADRLSDIERAIGEYTAIIPARTPVVVHDDLHMWNILVNAESKKLTGIIDFGFVNIVIPEESLWFWLKPFPPQIKRAACREYAALSGQPVEYRHVVACDLADCLRQFVDVLREGDAKQIARYHEKIDGNLKILAAQT